MSNNPFADAIKPSKDAPKTHTVHDHPPFFQHAIEQEKLKQQARNMTRQDMFNNGLLTVEDMDDEELRCGRMRDNNGKIPRVTKTLEMVPRDLYDEMVAEHNRRTQENYRQMMDVALNTIVEIMVDPTVEPKDRLDAAKHIKEQVMGKTPERVQVTTTKLPYEQLMGDVAQITRAQHLAMKQGALDVESFEVHDDPIVDEDHGTGTHLSQDGTPTTTRVENLLPPGPQSADHTGQRPVPEHGQAVPSGARPTVGQDPNLHHARHVGGHADSRTGHGAQPAAPTNVDKPQRPDTHTAPPTGVGDVPDVGLPGSGTRQHGAELAGTVSTVGGPRYIDGDHSGEVHFTSTLFTPAEPAPSHDAPATNNPTLSAQIREAHQQAARLAAARKARLDAVKQAKKRRIVQRALGLDVKAKLLGPDALKPLQDKMLDAMDTAPIVDDEHVDTD